MGNLLSFLKGGSASESLRRRVGRILLSISLGIVTPAVVLTYFGFRSFSYEDRLVEKQLEERHAASTTAIRQRTQAEIRRWIDALGELSRDSDLRSGSYARVFPRFEATHRLGALPVENIFYIDAENQIKIPPMPVAAPGVPLPSAIWGPFADRLAEGQRLEFVERNIPRASAVYESLYEEIATPYAKAELLKMMANAQRKNHAYAEAEKTLRRLIERYDQLPDQVGYPTGVVGRLLLVGLLKERGQITLAASESLRLLESLALVQWPLSPATVESVREQEEAWLKTLAQSETLTREQKDLWAKATAQFNLTARAQHDAQTFLHDTWPALMQRIGANTDFDHGGLVHVGSYILLAPGPVSPSGSTRGWLAAFIPTEAVGQQLDRILSELSAASGLGYHWEHAPWVNVPSREKGHVFHIASVQPPLDLVLTPPSSGPEMQIRRRRQRTFAGMIGLSLLVLVQGLVTLLQAVRREVQVSELKADFVANVSHELRTPLTAIGYIGERLETGRVKSEEQRKRLYEMLCVETRRLRELIDNVLDFSAMVKNKRPYRMRPEDLRLLSEDAARRLATRMEALGFSLEKTIPTQPVTLPLDARAVVQAITNLLDNAMKYSGAAKRLRYDVAEIDGGGQICVEDFGVGIPSSERERIFEKFYRVEHALTQKSEGVGLGLPMVKHIVEGHHGRITVTSEEGRGSRFTLWFPGGTK